MSGALAGLSMLVTGGGSGIGRAVVDAYVAAGGHVVVLDRSPENAEQLRHDHGDDVSIVVGDASDGRANDEAIDRARRDHGRLDQVTCCVGVFDYYASLRDIDPELLPEAAEEIWRANVLSLWQVAARAYPLLRSSRGSLTITLSVSAFRAEGGGVLYGSSKWALRGAVSHLAHDFAPEVRVNGVAPGGTVGTRLGGLRSLDQRATADAVPGRAERIRAGNLLELLPQPVDHVGAYLYLADPAASGVCTGVVIRTDGGRA